MTFSDFLSGSDGMVMILMLGGCLNSSIAILMLFFQNYARNYPIRGVPDNFRGVFYRFQLNICISRWSFFPVVAKRDEKIFDHSAGNRISNIYG